MSTENVIPDFPVGSMTVDFDGSQFAHVRDADLADGSPSGRWIVAFDADEHNYLRFVPENACIVNPKDRMNVATVLREYTPREDILPLVKVLLERLVGHEIEEEKIQGLIKAL